MAEKLTTLAKRLRPFLNGQMSAIAATGAFMTEGPDIDLVGNRIGRGGDTILIFNSDGTPVEEFAFTSTGLAQAIAAAVSGNVIQLPLGTLTLTADIEIPSGVCLRGSSRENTIISYAPAVAHPDVQNTAIDTNSKSILEDFTFNYSPTSSHADADVAAYGIRLEDAIARNITVNLTIDNTIYSAVGITGYVYQVATAFGDGFYYQSFHDIQVNVTGTYSSTYRGNDSHVYGIALNNWLGSTGTINAQIYNISTNIILTNTVEFAHDAYGFLCLNTADNINLNNIIGNIFIYGKTPSTASRILHCAAIQVSTGAYTELRNSSGHVYISDMGHASDTSEVMGIYSEFCTLFDCIGEVTWDSSQATNIAYGIYSDTYGTKYYNCQGLAIVDAGLGYGFYTTHHNDYIYDCVFTGTTYDIISNGVKTLYLYACRYDHTKVLNATLNYLQGDRAAYSVEDFHGNDIEATALIRHAPLPTGNDGYGIIEVGGNWTNSASALLTAGDLHDPVTLAADADAVLGISGQELNLDTQSANRVFAGPTTGAAADPTFRALVAADIPALALNDLSDVDTTGTGTGDIIYNNAGTWEDYPLGIGSKVTVVSNKIHFGNSAGGNYLEIDLTTGNLRLFGNATQWDDLRVSASVAKPGATAPSYKAFGPSGNLQALMFEAGHHDEVFFEIQMPHNWKEGTDIHPHVHWTPTTADAGNVVWDLDYSWANIDGTFGAPSTMATDARAAGGTAWVHKMDDFKTGGVETISGTGKTLSSMLVCRLHRNSNSGSDTLNKDVALLEFDIHYEVDSFGSDEELIKYATSVLLLESGDRILLETGDKLLLE